MSVYILKKIGGISNIKNISSITNHYTNDSNVDKAKSEASEMFRGNHFPSSVHVLNLMIDGIFNKYFFEGTPEELQQIVSSLNLKYEKGHSEEGKVISRANPEDINDPFFSHSYFQGRLSAKGGTILLDDSIPEQKLFILSYKANRTVNDKTKSDNYSVGAEWELISPMKEEEFKSEDNDKMLTAFSYLKDKNPETLLKIATILDIDADFKDANSIKNKLITSINENKKLKEFGQNFVDKFIELATSSLDDINPFYLVRRAISNGTLSWTGEYYQFKSSDPNAETSILARTVVALEAHFKKNNKQLSILLTEVKNRDEN